MTQFPAAVVSLSEQIENATGVDILSGFSSAASRSARRDVETPLAETDVETTSAPR